MIKSLRFIITISRNVIHSSIFSAMTSTKPGFTSEKPPKTPVKSPWTSEKSKKSSEKAAST